MLEADVNYRVAREFIEKVQRRALEAESLKSLTPDQQTLTIVNEELTALMGETAEPLLLPETGPLIVLMAGLNGAGKNNRMRQACLAAPK